ncbi:apolipoprotein N-acyltransferase [Novimethylophilus kurashikiensis]|uniref:Apolipoprotein N-acyltransferase n=1 Tax=Novimethylophilus kurashikiensis TaxID=1825523 RepID=A0A2R5FBF9_9PROT|nr:apolipoprotein N-acyltransferase [Novimethylophilus kurashikiensis]
MLTFLRHPTFQLIFTAALGALSVFGFAPYYIYPTPILALAGLFYFWRDAETQKHAMQLGFAFGMGLFGAGVSWIYVSLHDFGGMPSAAAIFATAAFFAFISLLPMSAGWALKRYFPHAPLLAAPLLWVGQEWVRGWIFTGFPWLTMGYSQVPYSPLAGFAPVLGVFGVSLLTAIAAAIVAGALHGRLARKQWAFALLGLWITGAALKHVEWSHPVGTPLTFSLLQGNISQDLKWREDEVVRTFQTYRDMALTSHAQLIVMPEMALPILMDEVPRDYLDKLAQHAKAQGGDILIGVPEAKRQDGETLYYNTMLSYGTAPTQAYRKFHLVPFGEFIPFKPVFGWIYRNLLHIPLADLASGDKYQQPMALSGQKIAMNICYEDVFGEEIIRQLPAATLLINVSNDAWYGESLAADQHMQMSMTRALETARMVLRATNTGATAVINREGRVIAHAPHFKQLSLDGAAQGYAGTTPYVLWGNVPAIALIFLGLGVLWVRKKK